MNWHAGGTPHMPLFPPHPCHESQGQVHSSVVSCFSLGQLRKEEQQQGDTHLSQLVFLQNAAGYVITTASVCVCVCVTGVNLHAQLEILFP